MEYVRCENTTETTTANYLMITLKDACLDVMTCRSQAYYGAGNKSGKWKGAAAVFRFETGNESAGYLHCVSHEFNLCLSKVSQVFNMVSTMQALGIFFKYSPKRQRKLKQAIA